MRDALAWAFALAFALAASVQVIAVASGFVGIAWTRWASVPVKKLILHNISFTFNYFCFFQLLSIN